MKIRLRVLFVILLVSLSSGSATRSSAPEDIAVPADLASALSQRVDFSSYRSNMQITAVGTKSGRQVESTSRFWIEYTHKPLVRHVVISSKGFQDTEGLDSLEAYEMEKLGCLKVGDVWTSSAVDMFHLLLDVAESAPAWVLNDKCLWEEQPVTEFDGLPVYHWRLRKENTRKCTRARQIRAVGKITSVEGDAYVTMCGGYLAAANLVLEGTQLSVGVGDDENVIDEGRVYLSVELYDVNEPFIIEVPEEALAAAGIPQDIPMPRDAEALEVLGLQNGITFLSVHTPQELAEFFRREMDSKGWIELTIEELGGSIFLMFRKGNRSASFDIYSTKGTSKTGVLIIIKEDHE